MNHFDKIFALQWFHEKLPILASNNTALNSYSKPYDNHRWAQGGGGAQWAEGYKKYFQI